MDNNQFSRDSETIEHTPMNRPNKEPDTFEDDEFNRAMEESLREDRELLEKLAKI